MITDMDLGFGNDNDPETELSFVNQWKLSNGEFFQIRDCECQLLVGWYANHLFRSFRMSIT